MRAFSWWGDGKREQSLDDSLFFRQSVTTSYGKQRNKDSAASAWSLTRKIVQYRIVRSGMRLKPPWALPNISAQPGTLQATTYRRQSSLQPQVLRPTACTLSHLHMLDLSTPTKATVTSKVYYPFTIQAITANLRQGDHDNKPGEPQIVRQIETIFLRNPT